MEHLKLTVKDIMQTDVLYFDKDVEKACVQICEYLKIDNLPDIDGKSYHQYVDGKFKRLKIRSQHKISINTNLNEKALLEKFRKNQHNVLFAFQGDILKGIVHISDYNKDIVLQRTQDDILLFERSLRQLILLHGYKNEHMLDFYTYMFNKSSGNRKLHYNQKMHIYKEREEEITSLGPFQIFDFSDLMLFSGSSFSNMIFKERKYTINGNVFSSYEILRNLRNLAMHGKNPISIEKENSIYSIGSLISFLDSLKVLQSELFRLLLSIRSNKDFIRSIQLENKSKLEIILTHHPKAIEYFLGLR